MPEEPLYTYFKWSAEKGFREYKTYGSQEFEGGRTLTFHSRSFWLTTAARNPLFSSGYSWSQDDGLFQRRRATLGILK